MEVCPWCGVPAASMLGAGLRPGGTGTDPGGRIFEPTLQPTQVRHLAQMLTPFDEEMAEHSPNGMAWAPRGIRTPLKIHQGQPIEIPQRGAADGLVVRQAVCDGEPWQGGYLLHRVAETVVLDWEPQLLVPGLA